MIKHFCDYCGEEISDKQINSQFKVERNTYNRGTLSATIVVQNITIGYSNKSLFEICKYCLVDLVKSLDDRTIAEHR